MAMKTYEDAVNASSNHGSALISDARLRELYATMLRCRMLSEHLHGAAHPENGFEAPAVALTIDLKPGDSVSATRHQPALSMIQGASTDEVLRAARNGHGSPEKNAESEERIGILPHAENIDTQVKIAAGVALAHKMRKSENVVVVFLPPGAGAHELPADALRLAMDERLPLILVAQEAAGEGGDDAVAWDQNALPVIPVDGSDVVAVYRVRQESMARARRGSGPTLIDCRMRFAEGGSSRNRLGGTSHAKPERDAIANMAAYLGAKNLFNDAWRASLVDSFRKELKAASRAAHTRSKRPSR